MGEKLEEKDREHRGRHTLTQATSKSPTERKESWNSDRYGTCLHRASLRESGFALGTPDLWKCNRRAGCILPDVHMDPWTWLQTMLQG